MKTNNIVNAPQLFLLCALRGATMAKNLEIYSWTHRHHFSFLEKMAYVDQSRNSFEITETKRDIIEEVAKKIRYRESREREFILYRIDSGFSLCDNGQDLSWWCPSFCCTYVSEWAYDGNFELSSPLTEKEKFILDSYFLKLGK